MEVKYKAFISYRHLPLDKGVAIKLHHAIEHFSIPKALRKNGEKTPGRVFRDQDELPISSDLSGDIERALDNSEFLIVICSKETKNSKWVLREISYFLEHHDRSHVLAVLVEGTPEESFPKELTDEYSEEGKYIRSVEPLAANIVADSSAKRNALFRTEKLRIMAALIGCTYDSLYKREQRYVIRKVATAAAVVLLIAAGFIGVLLNRNAMITKNYENTLRSQSTYLANASQALLKEGDRLGAIALAIEALPSEGNDRPLVPCAQRALDEAVNAYLSPSSVNGRDLQATGIISPDDKNMKFEVEQESGLVCVITRNGIVSLWNSDTCTQLWKYETGKDYSGVDVQFIDSKSLILEIYDKVLCLNTADGSVKWQALYKDIVSTDSSFSMFECIQLSENKQRIYAFDEFSMIVLDSSDGSVLSKTMLPVLEEEGEPVSYYLSKNKTFVSDDEKFVFLFFFYNADYSWDDSAKNGICVLNAENLEPVFTTTDVVYGTLGDAFLHHDNLLFIALNIYNDDMYISDLNNGELGMQTNETKLLICLDFNSGTIKWTSRHTYSFLSRDSITYWTLPDGTEVVIYAYANHVDIIKADDGGIVSQAEFFSVVRNVNAMDNGVQVICQDGKIGYIWFENMLRWFYEKQLKEGVNDCKKNSYYYWVLDNNDVLTRYSVIAADPSWIDIPIENREESYTSGDYIINDDGFVMFSSYDLKVICGNKDGLRTLYLPTVSVEDSYGYSTYRRYSLKALEGNQRLFSWTFDDSHGVLYLDILTGEFREVTCDTELRERDIFRKENGDGWYLLAIKQESFLDDVELHFLELDDEMNIKREMTFEDKVSDSYYDIHSFYDGNGKLYIHYEDTDKTYQLDINSLTVKELPDDISEALNESVDNFYLEENVYFDTNRDHIIIRKDESTLLIYKNAVDLVKTLDATSSAIVSVWFSSDNQYMFTLETDANLRRYSTDDWSLLSCKSLHSIDNISIYEDIMWQDTDKDFFCLNVGDCMHLIDKKEYDVLDVMSYCYGYMEKEDFFLCREGSYDFGGFPRHTTESLIEYGKEILNGWELSSEQKYEYGLD
ncbi:MAG: toll/interleukin-1 receptor domain-containing protein [Erysipelotrichaceae bacterium]|nr:toll/interleukin-1 receptor domain-containing protein [Erysipelotrichaceae bacterium]